MTNGQDQQTETPSEVVMRSRKANRRTLKGCVTQAERIQQQLRNVGMQYVNEKPVVFRALNAVHSLIEECKKMLVTTGNEL